MLTSIFSIFKHVYARWQIRRSLGPFFDPVFYRNTYPELKDCDDLLGHYINSGWLEARDPTVWFSTFGYLEANQDVRESGINPFYHYVKHGRTEGRNPFRNALARETGSDIAVWRSDRNRVVPPQFLSDLLRHRGILPSLAAFDEAREALAHAGFYSPTLTEKFRPSEYRLLISAPLRQPADALVHFAQEGYKQILPIAFDLEFDEEFYKSYILGVENLSTTEAYFHWLSKGLLFEYPPNAKQLLQKLHLKGFDFPKAFDTELYRENNADLHVISHSHWLLLEHFIKIGARERRPGCPLTLETADLYTAAADCLVDADQDFEAQRLYEAILTAVPQHKGALVGLGICLQRQGQFAGAAVIHSVALKKGVADYEEYSNLICCLLEIGSFDQALVISEAAITLFPSDLRLRERRFEILGRRYWRTMQLAYAYARSIRRDTVAHHAMRAANELIAALSVNPNLIARRSAPAIKSIAICGDHNLNQCRLYRIEQKVEQLQSACFDVSVFRSPEDFISLADQMHAFDAIIFYRTPATPEVIRLIQGARQLGVKTFYEIDDLIFDPANYPDDFESYAGLISREEYAGLLSSPSGFRAAAQCCDFGIASTVPLARHLEKLVRSGKVFVHRNGIGRAHIRALESNKRQKSKRELVIFFGSGTKAHSRDFAEIAAPALARVLKAHPHVRLILRGYHKVPPALASCKDQIELLPPLWDFGEYLGTLATADINISALRRNVFSDCKSEIKWLEAAMYGIPSVVSRTSNYEDTIRHGETGFLAETEDEWFEALDGLVRNGALRALIGENARREILTNYSEAVFTRNLRNMLVAVMQEERPAPMTKKILVVNIHYPPFAIGGATRIVYDNVREISGLDERFEIEIFAGLDCNREPYKLESYSHDGVRVTTVSLPFGRGLEKVDDPRMQEVFLRYLERVKPDLIHFHCIQRLTAALPKAARTAKIPYVVTVHDGWWISPNQFLIDSLGRTEIYATDDRINMETYGPAGAYRARQLRECLTAAARVIAVSESFGAIYRAAGFTNTEVIPNGLSFMPAAARLISPDGRVRMGFLGGVEYHKGLALIRAALRKSSYKNLALTIIDHSRGSGGELQEVWGETPVTFIGRVQPDEMSLVYGRLDVLLAPSIWPESYGLVTREALYFGLWVVASEKGAIGDAIVPGDNGFLIDVDTPNDLMEVLSLMDSNPQRYLEPPPKPPPLRRSCEQARETANLYASLICGKAF